MADYYADGGIPTQNYGYAQASPRFSFSYVVGASLSLALTLGIGVWGYKLMVRDVSGVPVVRAIEGPMRVQPADPGGRLAENQGLAVNAVAAEGAAAAPAQRLVLAPPPISLDDEDAPLGDLAAQALAMRAATAQAQSQSQPVALTSDAPPPTAAIAAAADADVAQLVEQLSRDATPFERDNNAGDAPVDASIDAAETGQMAAGGLGGLATSLRPVARPNGLVSRVSVTDNAVENAVRLALATATSGPREIAPENVPLGTRLAQLGAFDSPDQARAEWQRLELRFGDYMVGKNRVIQEAQSGGRTFYRLRAMGFDDLNDARRFCAAFVAERTDCIPVVTR
jgi:hypothetical protein